VVGARNRALPEASESVALKPRLRGVSHEWGFYVSLAAGVALVASAPAGRALLGALIYAVAVSALLGVSALYHRIDWRARARRWLRRLDHAMIFVLIAATNTPFALLALHGTLATVILALAWAGAAGGIVLQLVWTDHPKWASSLIGIGLGWVGLATLTQLPQRIGWAAVAVMILAGALYTAGAVIYARERPNPIPGVFGYHEVFHACTVVGATLHFVVVVAYALPRSRG
jgi:hemolysin III